jgi:hypothetical protein
MIRKFQEQVSIFTVCPGHDPMKQWSPLDTPIAFAFLWFHGFPFVAISLALSLNVRRQYCLSGLV